MHCSTICTYLGHSAVKIVHDHVHHSSCLFAVYWVLINRVGPTEILKNCSLKSQFV